MARKKRSNRQQIIVLLTFLIMFFSFSFAYSASIITVAGNGGITYPGDGVAATQAGLAAPRGTQLDAAGNLFITAGGNRVFKITKNTGMIATFAGNGTSGFSGDGGPATLAQLNSPESLFFDSYTNLFIGDSTNNRIRVVNPAGTITTFYGDGSTTALATIGDFLYDGGGNLIIADRGNHRVLLVPPTGGTLVIAGGSGTGYTNAGYSGDGGLAVNALLNTPIGLAVDASGNIYICDGNNHRLRKITRSTGIINTIAGNGTQGYSGDGMAASSSQLAYPEGLEIDSSENIYIADTGNDVIRKIDGSTNIISTVAGNGISGFSGDYGSATSAMLNYPIDVRVDNSNDLYISDTMNNRIRKVSFSDQTAPAGTIEINPGSEFANQINVTLALTCTDIGGSDCWQMRFKNQGGNYSTFIPVAESASWILAQTEGLVTVTVQFADSAGNLSGEISDTITLDLTTPPAPTISSPAAGTTFSTSSPVFSGQGEPFATIDLQNVSWATITTTQVDANGNWSTAVGPLPDGTNTIYAFTVDRAGNCNSSAFTQTYVHIDSAPPNTPVINSPADNSSTEETVLTISGTEERVPHDALTYQVSTITLYDGTNELGSVTATPISNETSSWSISTGELPAGLHSFSVTATDAIGNVSAPSAPVHVTIVGPDTVLPVVTPPADIELDAQSPSGNSYGQAEITAFLAAATAEDNVDGSLPVSNDVPTILPLGVTTVTFSATDSAGNTGTATAVITISDLSPPVITTPADTTAIAHSVDGISRDEILDTLYQASGEDIVDGSFTVQNGKLSHDAPAVLPIGDTIVTFSATDAAGNSAAADFTITVEHKRTHLVTPFPGPLGTLISIGGNHSMAIKGDGTLVGWGLDHLGQATVPEDLGTVTSVSNGNNFTVAVKVDGTVAAWGDNSNGQLAVPADLNNVKAISAGGGHGLALKSDGTVVAWGLNTEGQATVPAGLTDVIAIAAGGAHSLALKKDGSIVGWGHNSYGQTTVPPALSGVIEISAGAYHSVALKSDGTVAAWGSLYMTKVPAGLTGVTAISAGVTHTVALKADGTIATWGINAPQTDLDDAAAIAAGSNSSLAIREDGTVAGWGNNTQGQLNIPDGLNLMPFHGSQGLLTPVRPQVVDHGDTIQFELIPQPGYSASIEGTCGGILTGNQFTTDPITGDCTVVANFFMPLPGDVNQDGEVDLADAIVALQVIAGRVPSGKVSTSGDVNGDQKIGLGEIIAILKQL